MIAVICAHNPGKRNLGMYSVDLSAQAFFSAGGQPFDLVKFTGHQRIGALRYKTIATLKELEPYDTIVFWGDFQQNPIWGLKNFGPRYARKHQTSEAEGFLRWKELCLFLNQDLRPSQRLFSVGTCFLGAREALKDGAEVSEYGRLLARFRAIVPRDEGSFAELEALGIRNVVRGFDCAALIDREPAPPVTAPCFGYSFGRTLGPQDAALLVRNIEQLTGHRALPIHWLLNRYALKLCHYRYTRALKMIRRVRCVITDIYHLSINTLNLNRDLVCVGLESEGFSDTCDDDKKAILLRTVGLENRYVAVPGATRDAVAYIAPRIATLLRESPATVFHTFNRLRSDVRSQLQHLLLCND